MPPETEKREKCKKKVTYNDLRTFLKDTNSGITLFNYSFDILDEDGNKTGKTKESTKR